MGEITRMNGELHTPSIGAKVLTGHSGCPLYLLQRDGEIIVRKVSSNGSYNHRLESQCKKQQEYYHPYLQTPKVLGTGYLNGLFFFDMEYIQGMQLSKHIEAIKISECSHLLDPFLEHLDRSLVENRITSSIFNQKLRSLEEKVPNDKIMRKALAVLQETDWSLVSESPCHGDLTFENILLSKKGIYLIDFLDSFYNSWMLDLAKLLQDIELRWSYRKDQISENTNIRLLIIREIFIQTIEKSLNGAVVLPLLYRLLMLNLVRIVPYIKNEFDRIFIYSALERML